jgi:hypothetical protein
MAGEPNRLQESSSWIVRLLVSLILPAWGIALVIIGLMHGSAWWVASGIAIGIAGVITFVGGPLFDFHAGEG